MTADPFAKFRARDLHSKTIDTLIGLSQGIIADGKVNQKEAEVLLSWLSVNEATMPANPLVENLLDRVGEMLADDVLDEDEARELHDLLADLSGGAPEGGELFKAAALPLDDPPPPIIFPDRRFAFTGTFMHGNRRECEALVQERGGAVQGSITKKLDYLVLGTYVTDSWKHQSFGNKIVQAMELRDSSQGRLAIVSEDHWINAAGFL